MTNEVIFTHSQEEAILQDLQGIDGQFNLDHIAFGSENFDCGSQQFPNQAEEYIKPYTEEKVFNQNMRQTFQEANTAPILAKDEFGGDYNFQLMLNPENSAKHWAYSKNLCKIFIQMEQVLPLFFQWTPTVDGLWVRATMVYKLDQHRSIPVIRCPNHMATDTDIDQRHLKHVIRCTHPASSYQESASGHLSVVTPLGTPVAGAVTVPVDFKFFCKNSCTAGMNRRPTEIIFTLETANNQILARRKLEVRICSCPKRDKDKEEKEVLGLSTPTSSGKILHGKKRKHSNLSCSSGKKIIDNKVYRLSLDIVGRDNYNAVVKSAHDIMAGAAIRTGNYELYKPFIDETLKRSLSQ